MIRSSTITVHWHDENQPVYSVDFQPNYEGIKRSSRLVTGGGDNNVRVWKLLYNTETGDNTVEYLTTLRKHTQAVNVVRFDPKGDILATAGDDGTLILWTLSDHIVKEFGAEEDDEVQESWVVKHIFRSSTSEIYDLSWSPDSRFIATGSMDNITRIYNVSTGQQVGQLAEHNHYVQGVAWDPRNEFLATQSADRSVHIYSLKKNEEKNDIQLVPTTYFKITKAELPSSKLSIYDDAQKKSITEIDNIDELDNEPKESKPATPMSPPSIHSVQNVKSPAKQVKKTLSNDTLPAVRPISTNPKSSIGMKNSLLYHSETLQSFFRRLTFSPDGSLLLTPLGIFKTDSNSKSPNKAEGSEDITNTVYVYIRSGLNKSPICHIPGLKKPAIAISFSPIIYKVNEKSEKKPVFKLPYKMIFAIATQDAVIIYDTVNLKPLGFVSNLHYSTITDLCWNKDGQSIIVSSADGFCSNIAFDNGIFGEVHANSSDNCKFWELNSNSNSNGNANFIDEQHETEKVDNGKVPTGKDSDKNDKKTIINMLKENEVKPQDPTPSNQSATDRQQFSIDQFRAKPIEKQDSEQLKKKRKIVPTLITK